MPDPKVAAAFADHAPWVTRFRIGEEDYGGTFDAPNDPRLVQFWAEFPEARTILELGSLEGGHSIALARKPGVTRVLGIEGRAANITRARVAQELLRAEKIEFLEANLEAIDLTKLGSFDVIFCSGLLYHLPEPWRLLEQLPRVAGGLFLWTHCAPETAGETAHGYRGQRCREGGPDEVLSGLSPDSFWPTLGSLCHMLTQSGYARIHLLTNNFKHSNGPAVTIAAFT